MTYYSPTVILCNAHFMLDKVDADNRTQAKLDPGFQCIIASCRPPVALKRIKIPFPLFPLVVLRAEDCAVAWVPVKKPLSVWAVKALSSQRGWGLPSVCITPASLIDSLFALSCLSASSHCPLCPQKIIQTLTRAACLPKASLAHTPIHTQTYSNVYMYSESAHSLPFSLRELGSPSMDPWIPHNTICWLINNSILSVSKHVWIQSHLHLPWPSLNKVGVVSLSSARLMSVWVCVLLCVLISRAGFS